MSPKSIDYKRSFIFLNWKLSYPVLYPGMPRTSQRFIGPVFMEKIPFITNYVITKFKKITGNLKITGFIKGNCYKSGISGPDIPVIIAAELKHVRVPRSNDCSGIVKVGAHYKKRFFKKFDYFLIQSIKTEIKLINPCKPIILG